MTWVETGLGNYFLDTAYRILQLASSVRLVVQKVTLLSCRPMVPNLG